MTMRPRLGSLDRAGRIVQRNCTFPCRLSKFGEGGSRDGRVLRVLP
jgi:hypothetical protein